jgi:hypothetical protein
MEFEVNNKTIEYACVVSGLNRVPAASLPFLGI